MPAGDLITEDWQAELRATLTGKGTLYGFDEQGITGLGVTVKSSDLPRQHAAGSYRGRDYADDHIVTIPYVISVNTGTDAEKAEAAGAAWVDLTELWAPSESTDEELHLQLPGIGHVFFTGRPRGLVDDLRLLRVGVVRALATFFADPEMTIVSVGS